MVKSIRMTKGRKAFTRTGFKKYNRVEVWGKKGLVGTEYWSKRKGTLVKVKRKASPKIGHYKKKK